MEDTVENKTSRLATYAGYFISGAAVGTVLGVLYAPKAGRETREQMSAWLKEKREKGRAGYQAMKEALESRRRSLRTKVKEMPRV